jgi:hypothetical protein
MIRHIFLDKCNTINKDSKLNTGLNPVVELNTGKHISRILLHFDVNDLKENVTSGNYQIENLKHILKMYNCGSINLPSFEEEVNVGTYNKVRASSFDVYAFILPYEWDRGRGFDSEISYLKGSNTVNKKEGSTWFNTRTHNEWDEPGVYSYETLINNETLIVAKQHFDSGLEDLELDITDYVNNLLLDKLPNFGLGLMFCPEYEQSEDDLFVSFFGPETNTFFNPYVETTNSELILDNRYNFHLGVSNKLYFFL